MPKPILQKSYKFITNVCLVSLIEGPRLILTCLVTLSRIDFASSIDSTWG